MRIRSILHFHNIQNSSSRPSLGPRTDILKLEIVGSIHLKDWKQYQLFCGPWVHSKTELKIWAFHKSIETNFLNSIRLRDNENISIGEWLKQTVAASLTKKSNKWLDINNWLVLHNEICCAPDINLWISPHFAGIKQEINACIVEWDKIDLSWLKDLKYPDLRGS